MAGDIYSTRFLILTGESSGTVSYIVPAGFVAVVRDIGMVAAASSSGLLCDIGGVGMLFASFVGTGTDWEQYHWSGRQVINAEEALVVGIAAGTLYGAISGYLLVAG